MMVFSTGIHVSLSQFDWVPKWVLGQYPPGEYPPRTISPGQYSPRTNPPRTKSPPPPVPISPRTKSPWTISPRMISLVKHVLAKKICVLNYPKICVSKTSF